MNDLLVLVLGTLTTVLTVAALIFLAYLFQRKLYRQQLGFQQIEKLLRKEELRSAYAFIEGREAERQKIAQDLHDNLGSLLATLRLYLDRLRTVKGDPEEETVFEKVIVLLTQTSEETRRLSHELETGGLMHFGLSAALVNLCETIQASGKLTVLHHLDISAPIEAQMSLHLYRIVQELFSNTLKHAGARQVRLEVTQIAGEYLNLIYEDDGKGFQAGQVNEGLGLKNIRSRVQVLSGEFTLDSKENRGTTFNLEIPLGHGEEPLA